jgi:hypothetical protein
VEGSFSGFAVTARQVAAEARRLGLDVPDFRSPPRVPGRDRTLVRRPDGTASVAVRVRGRSPYEVVTDVIEGVLAVNGLSGPAADGHRRALRAAAAGTLPRPWRSAPSLPTNTRHSAA